MEIYKVDVQYVGLLYLRSLCRCWRFFVVNLSCIAMNQKVYMGGSGKYHSAFITWRWTSIYNYNVVGGLTVSFICIWLILMRNSLLVKSWLKAKWSASCTSRPRGALLSTRALPHASDCSVRRSSPSCGGGRNRVREKEGKKFLIGTA